MTHDQQGPGADYRQDQLRCWVRQLRCHHRQLRPWDRRLQRHHVRIRCQGGRLRSWDRRLQRHHAQLRLARGCPEARLREGRGPLRAPPADARAGPATVHYRQARARSARAPAALRGGRRPPSHGDTAPTRREEPPPRGAPTARRGSADPMRSGTTPRAGPLGLASAQPASRGHHRCHHHDRHGARGGPGTAERLPHPGLPSRRAGPARRPSHLVPRIQRHRRRPLELRNAQAGEPAVGSPRTTDSTRSIPASGPTPMARKRRR